MDRIVCYLLFYLKNVFTFLKLTLKQNKKKLQKKKKGLNSLCIFFMLLPQYNQLDFFLFDLMYILSI